MPSLEHLIYPNSAILSPCYDPHLLKTHCCRVHLSGMSLNCMDVAATLQIPYPNIAILAPCHSLRLLKTHCYRVHKSGVAFERLDEAATLLIPYSSIGIIFVPYVILNFEFFCQNTLFSTIFTIKNYFFGQKIRFFPEDTKIDISVFLWYKLIKLGTNALI